MNFPKPAVGMLPNDRLAYSPIATRAPLKLPKGARMVVWTVTNVEEWDPTQTMPRTVLTPPAGGVNTVRGMVWVGSHSSTLVTDHTTMRAPFGSLSGARVAIGE